MKFAAVITYARDPEKIAALRPEHRQYLTRLLQGGQLALAGPFGDDSGALIVYEAATQVEAEALLRGDPFHAQGIFQRYDLRPWKAVFGNHALLPGGGP